MVAFRRIKGISDNDFEEAMKIYEESFPLYERHPVETIKRRVKTNMYQMYIGQINDRIVFMALIYPLKSLNFILLDYMATQKDFRNKGIGTNFINYLGARLKERYSNRHLIFEVENPKYGNNKKLREKRVNFYRRIGAKEMKNVRYILPPLSGSNLPTEMILMIFPEYERGIIDGEIVKKIIIQIYHEVYVRERDDPLLNTFIDQIGQSIEMI